MLHHTSYVCIPRMCVYALCIDDDDFSISDCRRSNGAWEQCTKCWKKDRNKKRGQMNKWEIYHQSGTLAVENILQENVCSRKLLENCFGRFYRWWDASYLENCKLNILRYDIWLFSCFFIVLFSVCWWHAWLVLPRCARKLKRAFASEIVVRRVHWEAGRLLFR